MGYTILDRPAGTYAFAPSIFEQLAPLLKAGGQGITDMIYRKAAEDAGLQPEFKKDAEGNWVTSYEKPSNTALDSVIKMGAIKKLFKESAIDTEAPRLSKATNYYQKAIEAGGDPAKLREMIKPERFKYPEQQKEFREAESTGIKTRKELADKVWKPKTREEQLQFETDKTSARTTPKAVQPKTITPAQALNIISDPLKSQQFKKEHPEEYGQLEEIALQAMGKKETPKAVPATVKKPSQPQAEKFTIGQIITKGIKQYKIVGFDSDGMPMVDLVK